MSYKGSCYELEGGIIEDCMLWLFAIVVCYKARIVFYSKVMLNLDLRKVVDSERERGREGEFILR